VSGSQGFVFSKILGSVECDFSEYNFGPDVIVNNYFTSLLRVLPFSHSFGRERFLTYSQFLQTLTKKSSFI
jgi:hypothetical protein